MSPNRLYEIRKSRHVSQDTLAASIGSCRNTIRNIEKCKNEPSISLAYKIAAFFDMSVYEIFPNQ